ncbi:alpha/beta fold hydrolase [Hahella sp. NBU794]|uniref:alpha/beta fold hydrolase n=1 Tax=Hahella sp. NBU794 TaxID=3422590 RepID=UPI003D6DCF73
MAHTTNVVMIHGLMGSLSYFEPQKRVPDFRWLTPDLPGYAATPMQYGEEGFSLRGQAEYVRDLILNLDDGPCWVVGHSVGGAIAMLLAEAYPQLVRGLISVEGNFTLNDAFWCRKVAAMSMPEWRENYAEMQRDPESWLARAEIEATPERLEWAREVLLNQSAETVHAVATAVVKETAGEEYQGTVRRVVDSGLPLFLLSGERSDAGWDTPAYARAAARQSVRQKNTGHMMMLEAPDEFCDIVANFIRSN